MNLQNQSTGTPVSALRCIFVLLLFLPSSSSSLSSSPSFWCHFSSFCTSFFFISSSSPLSPSPPPHFNTCLSNIAISCFVLIYLILTQTLVSLLFPSFVFSSFIPTFPLCSFLPEGSSFLACLSSWLILSSLAAHLFLSFRRVSGPSLSAARFPSYTL